MARHKTVLVLGAGASAPYDLPVAATLREEIILRPRVVIPNRLSDDDPFVQIEMARMKELGAELRRSGQASIDAFLERRPQFRPQGIRAIAQKLVSREIAAIASDAVSSDWYAWLFRKLQTSSSIDCAGISIITFNYDRTLEFGFRRMLMSSFSLSESRAVSELDRLPTWHVYGSLAGPDTLEDIRRWHRNVNDHLIAKASEGIRIMEADRSNDDTGILASARTAMEGADTVVFLGFSFDAMNLTRIGATADNAKWMMGGKTIYATGYGLLEQERQTVQRLLGRSVRFGAIDQRCLEFLRDAVEITR